jgi:hypothetical protein
MNQLPTNYCYYNIGPKKILVVVAVQLLRGHACTLWCCKDPVAVRQTPEARAIFQLFRQMERDVLDGLIVNVQDVHYI